jgi:hypothetical protein
MSNFILRNLGLATVSGKVGLLLLFPLLFGATSAHYLSAAERYLPIGETVSTFDFFRHTNDMSKRTFSQNVGRVIGGALLENGDIALFLADERRPKEFKSTVYVIRVDPSIPDSFAIISGPHTPLYSQNEDLSIVAGPTLFGDDSYAFIGYWQEINLSGNYVRHHYYVMVAPRAGGEALILFELPQQPEGHPGQYNDIVYLEAEGLEPDAFMFGLRGPAGIIGEFQLYSVQGSHIRTIHYPDLYLNVSPLNQCFHDNSLTLAGNGDLLAVRSDDRDNSTTCPSWINLSCVRFDRYGTFKGAWDFGRSIRFSPWRPGSGAGQIIELANGDILSSHLFSGHDIRDNDSNGTTYRNFIIRPKDPFGQPKCRVQPDSQWISALVNHEPVSGSVRISNIGSAPLQVEDVVLAGENAGLYTVSGNTAFNLDPGYGISDHSGSYVDLVIQYAPAAVGNFPVQLEVHSTDPVNPVQAVTLKGIALPENHVDSILLEPGVLDPLPNVVKGLEVSGTSGMATVVLRIEPNDTEPFVRVLSVPVLRDEDDGIAGLDVENASITADELPESVIWFKFDDDGMMWYGPVVLEVDTSKVVPVVKWGVVQRKPDGTEYRQTLQYDETMQCWDCDFIPGKEALLFVINHVRAPLRYDRISREDGFYDLAFRRGLNECVTTGPLASVSVIPHVQQRLVLVHSNDPRETILYRGWTDEFWLNEEAPSPQDGFTLSTALDIGQINIDAVGTDFVYVNLSNQVHRLTGFLDMADIDSIRIPIVQWIWCTSSGIILQWDPMEIPVGVEASQDLVNWIRLSEPSDVCYRRFLYDEIEGLSFFRLFCD